MAHTSLRNLINHIVNGSFADNICFVCLSPLQEYCENIFTKVCKEGVEYSVADVLTLVFNIKFEKDDSYSVCPDCFIGALSVYKFHLQMKRSQEILNFYILELSKHLDSLDLSPKSGGELACITLPTYEPEMQEFRVDLGLFASDYIRSNECGNDSVVKEEPHFHESNEPTDIVTNDPDIAADYVDSDENLLIVMNDSKPTFYRMGENGSYEVVTSKSSYEDKQRPYVSKEFKKRCYKKKLKERKKRSPMAYIKCNECPVKYRFVSKLREHMKSTHDIDLFICKVCKAIIGNEMDFYNHLRTHTNIYVCAVCGIVLKKRKTIISHLQRHEELRLSHITPGTHVCETCNFILPDAEALRDHCDKKHEKRHICFYCGRTYKGESSFELHIKKHEMYMKNPHKYKCGLCPQTFMLQLLLERHIGSAHGGDRVRCKKCNDTFPTSAALREHDNKKHSSFNCELCSRNFVDARALMWHQRLHNNERPYVCDLCGRGFVSENRRNQHSLCAHTAPTRRCPLCPALFHLRSMVNTHIRKVHLKEQRQRRNKSSKYGDVYWLTETVPIQELSIAVQNQLLDMQTQDDTPT